VAATIRFRAALGAIGVAASLAAGVTQDVVREGAGERRAALDAMEGEPLEPGLFDVLRDWSVEDPPTLASLRGKVVLIVTWSGWYPPAAAVLTLAQSLSDRHAENGLVVIGVHHERGFAGAERVASARGVEFPYAHDAEGRFRTALKVDQDPDFYVLDRAGQLGYADIATESVPEAVRVLLEESRADAESFASRREALAAERDRQFRQTESINQSVDLRELPEVSFTDPTPVDYFNASWPSPPPESPGSREPRWQEGDLGVLAFPQSPQAWSTGEPPRTKGRVLIAYFWNPDMRAGVYQETMRDMERVQKEYGRDVVVAGVLSPGGDERRRSSRRDPNAESETERNQRWLNAFQGLSERRQFRHHLLFEPSGGIQSAVVESRNMRFGSRRGNDAQSLIAVIASSDGRVRWYGFAGEPSFYASLERILRVDPGVSRRREAERRFIRERTDP